MAGGGGTGENRMITQEIPASRRTSLLLTAQVLVPEADDIGNGTGNTPTGSREAQDFASPTTALIMGPCPLGHEGRSTLTAVSEQSPFPQSQFLGWVDVSVKSAVFTCLTFQRTGSE